MAQIALLGGTGREGRGLAARFALAGEDVIIGSRQPDRALRAADALRQRLAAMGRAVQIRGVANHIAANEADHVALTLPYAAVAAVLATLTPSLAGKIVLDVVNPLAVHAGVFTLAPVPAGSAGELIQQLLPESLVVSGFKNLSAQELCDVEQPLRGDVLLCSDAPRATRLYSELVDRIPHLRPVDAGALANCRRLESITALLLNLNRRHDALTSIHILGLTPEKGGGGVAAGYNLHSGGHRGIFQRLIRSDHEN